MTETAEAARPSTRRRLRVMGGETMVEPVDRLLVT